MSMFPPLGRKVKPDAEASEKIGLGVQFTKRQVDRRKGTRDRRAIKSDRRVGMSERRSTPAQVQTTGVDEPENMPPAKLNDWLRERFRREFDPQFAQRAVPVTDEAPGLKDTNRRFFQRRSGSGVLPEGQPEQRKTTDRRSQFG